MAGQTYFLGNRRLRANSHIRELAGTVNLSHRDFIQPLFVEEGLIESKFIPSLYETHTHTIDSVLSQIENDLSRSVSKFLLFPIPIEKTKNEFNYDFVMNVTRKVKENFGSEVWLAADVCLCAYTSHGHCGILNDEGTRILNNESVKEIANYSLQLAEAGADCIAPSDMMDGRVGAIRSRLDGAGRDEVSIMSYSSKFNSAFYGPFRDACKSTPGKEGFVSDRKSYQISTFNFNDSIASSLRDYNEGADILMVKPAIPYLDIIAALKQITMAPIAAYHVSGEYQSLELMVANGLIDREKAHTETWTSLKRGGATIIISYAARHAKEWIEKLEF